MPQIQVERSTCEGYGNCVSACSDVFDLDDDGLVVVDDAAAAAATFEDLQRAAYDCPTESITITK
jgi:ferredoxin